MLARNSWLYIAANCAVAVGGVLGSVEWPGNMAPWATVAVAMVNIVGHAITGPGPAAKE